MPTAELLSAWKPRLTAQGYVSAIHSQQLVDALTAEFVALGHLADVARLAAASVVNMQSEPNFGLLGSDDRDGILAAKALTAINAWADAQTVAIKRAA